MSPDRDPAYLLDILIAARRIRDYTQGVDRQAFEVDIKLQDAVIRRFEIMGEAARRVSEEFREAHPDLPWSEMIGMRNVLIHDYNRVNLNTVWNVIQNNILTLIEQLTPLVPPEEPDDDPPAP